MAHRIDTVEARSKLKARTAPYWQKLSSGCHLGFRKMAAGSEGTWIAQAYDPATKKQTRRSLGAFGQAPAHRRMDEAKKAAETWFEHMGRGGNADSVTVRRACEKYVAHVRADKGDAAANDLNTRFARWVYGDKIADLELPKLARKHLHAWRQRLAGCLVVVNPHADQKQTRARAASSVNRDTTPLRAALNFALDSGDVTSDMAWRVPLRPIENADRQRDAYLDRSQRIDLLASAAQDAKEFLRGLCLVPLRPGALSALTAASFDKRLGVLTIGKDKSGRDRRIKLPAQTAAFFAAHAKDKLPSAPLLSRANGKQWDKDAWKKPVKAAARAAGLPDTVTAYSMRHSAITDLVTGGLNLLTVAQLSGTSVAMIERHYGHLRADHAAAALANLAL